jgi:hypothetical protein
MVLRVCALAAFNFDIFGDDFEVSRVREPGDRRALRLNTKARFALAGGTDLR